MEKVAAEVRLELLNLPVPLFLSGMKNNTPKGFLTTVCGRCKR